MIVAEIVHDSGENKTTSQEIKLSQFGYCYEPTGYTRVATTPSIDAVEEAQEPATKEDE